MLILTLDDAAKVAKQLVDDGMNDEVIIRQELEQKCWLPASASLKELNGLVEDINPAEICSQIQEDKLGWWCEIMRMNMQIAVKQISDG